ncbi:MAG: hypothetical protein ACK5LN_12455 [Propioniciclava sp.]
MVLYNLIPLLEGGQLPGWMPLAVAAVLFGALAFLWRSMRIHLKRADYPDEPDGSHTSTGRGSGSPESPV